MEAKDKIDWLKINYPNLELYPIEADELIEMIGNYHKQELEKSMPSDEIRFFVENPILDIYMVDNIKHFMNNGEADDNSIELSDKWNSNVTIVIDYLKSRQPKEPHNLEILDNNHLDEKA